MPVCAAAQTKPSKPTSRLQQLAGELTGNGRLQAKGVATQVEGKVQWSVGEVEGAVLFRSAQKRTLVAP